MVVSDKERPRLSVEPWPVVAWLSTSRATAPKSRELVGEDIPDGPLVEVRLRLLT